MFTKSISRFAVRLSILLSVLLGCTAFGTAQSCIGITPVGMSIDFGKFAVGTQTLIHDIILKNNCGTTIQVQSVLISAPEFQLVYGWVPNTKGPKTQLDFGVRFAPDIAGTITGTFTVNVEGFSPIVVSLSGQGYLTTAAASFSTKSITFSSQSVGATSAAQTLTITNPGTSNLTIDSVYADAPFTVTGFLGTTQLKAHGTLNLQVSFTPSFAGTYGGTLVMTSNQLPPLGVTLGGTATAATTLVISNYPTLESATQGVPYASQLTAAAGTGALKWSLATGSTLPTGLSLTTKGVITGTLNSSVAVGNYSFTINVQDSSKPPQTTSALLTIYVGAPNGATCKNIEWNVAGTKTPLVALTDLGTGTYLGAEGGLYPGGTNIIPASHDADGVTFANAIQPLDGNGNPDPNGKYALLSIGMSTTFDTFLQFMQDSQAEPTINPHLVFIPGAMPNAEAADWADPNFGGWTDIMDFFLPQRGVTANQVVAAWVSDTDSQLTGTFPSDMVPIQAELEEIAQNLHTFFPNLTIAFYNSRFYGGYSNGLSSPSSPEPYAYESGFAVQGVIADQLNGVPSMNYNPANGPVMAPWVAWTDYDWANGLVARQDGFGWSCQDFQPNGIHNSNPPGREKDTNLLLNFFRSDDATVPWFLNPLQ